MRAGTVPGPGAHAARSRTDIGNSPRTREKEFAPANRNRRRNNTAESWRRPDCVLFGRNSVRPYEWTGPSTRASGTYGHFPETGLTS